MRGGGVLTRWTVLQVPAPALSAGGPGAETHLPAAGGEPWSPRNLSYHIFSFIWCVVHPPTPPCGNSRNDTVMENENLLCNRSVSVRVMETGNTLCDGQCVCESYGN